MYTDLLDNELVKRDEHYLNKFGFVVIDKTQDNTAVSGVGVPIYTTCLRLETEKSLWNVKIHSQQLQINKVQYRHLTGNIELKNNFSSDFNIKTNSSFFSVFFNARKLSNFYLINGNKEIEVKTLKIKDLLLELRDKEIEIKKENGNLSFNFFFNSYFTDAYYDDIYNILSNMIEE